MDLPLARLLHAEPDVVLLPRLRRGGIEPADVVLLHFGEGAGIRLAPPSGARESWTLSWRCRLPPGPFDAGPQTVDAPWGSAGHLHPDAAMTAAHAAKQAAEVGRLAWRRLAGGLAGPEATVARLLMARLRLLALDATDGDVLPAMPEVGKTLDAYFGERARRPAARLWPGQLPKLLWELLSESPVLVGGAFQTALHVAAPPEGHATAHRRLEIVAEADAAKAAFAAAWPTLARQDFGPGVHLERLA